MPGQRGRRTARGTFRSQHFLHDGRLVERLIDRATVGPADLVVDVGAGRGIITAALARRGARVLAYEFDPTLCRSLRRRFEGEQAVRVIEGDFLDHALPRAPYKVFANVPFHITAAVVRMLLDDGRPPVEAWLVLQREAAEKFVGAPYPQTLAATLALPWWRVEILEEVPRAAFRPAPHVNCVLLQMARRPEPLVPADLKELYRDFVTHAFVHSRPTLRHGLRRLLTARQFHLQSRELGFPAVATPSQLDGAQWLGLFDCFEERADHRGRVAVRGAARRLGRQQARLDKSQRPRARRQRAV